VMVTPRAGAGASRSPPMRVRVEVMAR
jgi:hypothetical protein